MGSDLSPALATFAGGCVWLGLQPNAESAVATGVATAILADRVVAQMVGPQSRLALLRIQKKVAAGFEKWASTERIEVRGDIAQANLALKRALRTCMVDHAKIASAAFKSTTFVESAALVVIEALEAVDPIFCPSTTQNIARDYALSVIRIALGAAYSERSYFKALEPHLLLGLAQRVGGIAEAQVEHDRKLSEVLKRLQDLGTQSGLSAAQVTGILKAFEAEAIPLDQAESLLLRKAEEFAALKESLATSGLDQTGLREGLRAAWSAVDDGELDLADTILDGLLRETGQSLGESIRAVAIVCELRGHLANLRSKYADAAAYFQRGALIAETVDREFALFLWTQHAQSLSDHSRRHAGVASLEQLLVATFAASRLTVPGTPAEIEAKAASIGALGRLAERLDQAGAGEALSKAMDLGVQTLSSARAMNESPQSFVELANNLGSAIVHAVKLGVPHDLANVECALELLQEVKPLAREIDSPDLPNVVTHLANALRLKRDKLSVEQAIAERRIAIDLYTKRLDVWSVANAYNSLGNDYQALMHLNDVRLDQVALADALKAYRRALLAYRKGKWEIDRAQTQLNIGQTYQYAALRCDDGQKFYRLAEGHLGVAFKVFDQGPASNSWVHCAILLASVRLARLRGRDAEDERVEIAETLLFPVARTAREWSQRQVMDSLNLVFALWAEDVGADFRCRQPNLLARVNAFYAECAKVTQYTPLYPYIEMWRGQADLSIAVMQGDLVAATDAVGQVSRAAEFLRSVASGEEHLELLREVEESVQTGLDLLRGTVETA